MHRRAMLAGVSALAVSPIVIPTIAKAAAPLSGSTGSPYTRYKVGEFEITAFNDGTRAVDNPEKVYGVNQKPEDVAAAAEANFLPKDKMLNGFTPVLVNTGKELVLFDSGNGVRGQPATGRLAAEMKAAGIEPEQIDVVVITHCHPDHIGGLMNDGAPLAPKARYVIGEAEYQFWSSPDRTNGPTANAAKIVQANVVPLKDKMTFVKNEAEVASGIRAVEAFGHTPGHMAWHVESQGKRLLIGADFCNHYVLSLRYPKWHVSFDADKDQAVATRLKLLDMLSVDRVPFTSYHMPFPAVGFVEKGPDGGYRFVPASYQLML
ncbi:MBL fold metallo-hydrolase [Taklimakanibacter deserti]|uniref:MBL fold metallo-hydrolase n=1 Tax=Taklimakanibacter deserti TaxID=2267839 RepID=UPI000E64F48D